MYSSTFYNVFLVIILFNIKFAVDKIKQNMPISSTLNLITHPNHILTKISIILGMLILFCLTPAVAHIVGDNGATNIQGDKMIAYPGIFLISIIHPTLSTIQASFFRLKPSLAAIVSNYASTLQIFL